jgi:alpha-ribazole phosphatase
MKHIVFVRHGQSLANAGGVTMDHAAVPLTPLGHRQAERLAELLPREPSEVLASPFTRAQQTATPYCDRLGLSPRVHALAYEFHTFDPIVLEGMTGEQRKPHVDAYWQEADPTKRMGPKAETFREFETRVQTFMDESLPHLPDGAVLFGHGLWFGMLSWKLLGFRRRDGLGMKTFRRFQQGLPMPNGAVYHLLGANGTGWRIQADETIMLAVGEVADEGAGGIWPPL